MTFIISPESDAHTLLLKSPCSTNILDVSNSQLPPGLNIALRDRYLSKVVIRAAQVPSQLHFGREQESASHFIAIVRDVLDCIAEMETE